MQVKIFQKQDFVCDGRHIPVRFIRFIGKEAMITIFLVNRGGISG
jgi:hypothetical protein